MTTSSGYGNINNNQKLTTEEGVTMEDTSWSSSSKKLFSVRKTNAKDSSAPKKIDHKARRIRRRREDIEEAMAIDKEYSI